MLMLEFFHWWYGDGWRRLGRELTHDLGRIWAGLSVPLLLGTLFAPWRRIVSVGSGGFDAQIRAAIDNLVSRCVGATVRTIVLLAAFVLTFGRLILGIGELVAWPLLPPLTLALLLFGVVR